MAAPDLLPLIDMPRAPFPAAVSPGMLCLALLLGVSEAGAAGPELEWQAPEGCPSADFIQSEVARIVKRPWAELESSWRAVRARVELVDGRFGSRVSLTADNGEVSERSVSVASCTEAAEVVVAILTAGIAPSTSQRTGSERSAESSATASTSVVPDAGGAAHDESAGLVPRPLLGAEVGVDLGTLPAAAPFAQLVGGVALGSFELLGSFGATGQVLGEAQGSSAGAQMSLLMGSLLGCLRPMESFVSPSVCAGVELGRLGASGFGTSVVRDDARFWSASLARGSLDLRVGESSKLSLGVTAVVPFRHLRVVLVPEEVHRTPTVAVRPWLGLGVRFQ